MIDFLKHLLFGREANKMPVKNDFSEFFVHAKSKEKAKVIRQVLREANEEQKAMIERYKREEMLVN